jgi:NitT/TauT family transport system permease protein
MKSPLLPLSGVLGLFAVAQPVAVRVVAAPVADNADPLDAVALPTLIPVSWLVAPGPVAVLVGLLMLCIATLLIFRWNRVAESSLAIVGAAGGVGLPFALFASTLTVGAGGWAALLAGLILLTHALNRLATREGMARTWLVPGLFGAAILALWEIVVRGFDVPLVLLPPPSLIAMTLIGRSPVLADDFMQTVLRSALAGYAVGCAAGFVIAIACDRFPSLAKGLLPYANLLGAVPMIGIAPIMIMWFGFGWQSKAAVVIIVTVFPMMVNTLAGLEATDRIQLDLMRSLAAGYWRTLLKVRLPNALPFIFNALKINSTFALISAIVAEFFGTPIVGMGFRISTEVARMNLSMVWATIVVAAITGSAVYGGLTLVERAVTSWHPSFRRD